MNEMKVIRKKIGNIRVRPNQFQMIVEAMEKNPIMLNKPSPTYPLERKSKEWEDLTRKLNSKGGAIKSARIWQKSWTDKKTEVRKKHKLVASERLKPAYERNEELKLTKLEKRIAVLLGLDLQESLDEEQNALMPEVLVIPKVEDCSTSLASGSFHAQTPHRRNNQPFTQESNQSDLLPDTPSLLPDIEKSHQPESLSPQFIISEVNSSVDIDAQKGTDGQTVMAMALTRFAEALERQNELQERALEIKKQKADTFVEILNILKDKL